MSKQERCKSKEFKTREMQIKRVRSQILTVNASKSHFQSISVHAHKRVVPDGAECTRIVWRKKGKPFSSHFPSSSKQHVDDKHQQSLRDIRCTQQHPNDRLDKRPVSPGGPTQKPHFFPSSRSTGLYHGIVFLSFPTLKSISQIWITSEDWSGRAVAEKSAKRTSEAVNK